MAHFTFHDATTGEFVSAEHAEAHPDTTVKIEQQANLGLATTKELIFELSARVRVSDAAGEEWPNYNTFEGN